MNATKMLLPYRVEIYCLVFLSFLSQAQGRIVSGKVIGTDDGLSLLGVNITVKGTAYGTTTDVDGKYSIIITAEPSILIFSFVGYATQEVLVGERTVVNVKLNMEALLLNEIVITALGLQQSRDKAGSASTQITGSQIAKSGEPTLINGMSGKSSGLIISRTSGDPGASSYIQIRGQSSITNSVQPLIVMDGVPIYNSSLGGNGFVIQQSRRNDLNPNDIESIEVLKGASASALWGTRAGNGVIMITTKKGKSNQGKVNISYSGTYSIDKILTKHPLQNNYGQGFSGFYFTNVFAGGANNVGNQFSYGDKIANRPGGPDSLVTNAGYYLLPNGEKIYPIAQSDFATSANGGKRSRETFDPYDAVFQTGHFYDQTLTLSGGNLDGNYYISIGDLNQQGIVKEFSNYRRTSFRVNTEKLATNWLKLTSNFSYTKINSDRAQNGNNIRSILIGALRTPPDWNNAQGYIGSYVDPAGSVFPNRQLSYRNQIGKWADAGYDNPVWSMNRDKNSSEVDRFLGSLQIDISPFDWLTLTARGGLDSYTDKRIALFPVGTSGVPTGSLNINSIREVQYNFDGFARVNFKVGADWKLRGLVGFNANQRINDFVGGQINTFIITNNPPLSLDNSLSATDDPFNGLQQIRAAAAYGTADVEFRDMLFLSATGRAENSSNFSHTNNPTFFYPSVNLSWHPLKTFSFNQTMLSFAKVRAGFGVVSTVPGPYNTDTYWTPSVYADGWGNILQAASTTYGGGYEQSSVIGNPDLKPETKSEWEAGLELRAWKDRISFTGTYFNNTIRDVIIPVALAGSTGFTNRTVNVGTIKNKGIEVDFGLRIIQTKNWNLYINGNWTRIRNRTTDLGGTEAVAFGEGNAVVNHAVGVFYNIGFLREDDGKLILDAKGFPQAASSSKVLGDPNPDWRGGLGATLSWKNVSLIALFEHSHGGEIWAGTKGALINFGTHKATDHEVTISAADAAVIKNYFGATGTLVEDYGYLPNADGSYTVRGYLHDFGAGPVLVDEAWWTSLGGGFGAQLESFVESAQWTKLRELSLSYILNSQTFRKATKLGSVDFSFSGRNLFLWTSFEGNDPEANGGGTNNSRGREYFINPATRSFLITIKISY